MAYPDCVIDSWREIVRVIFYWHTIEKGREIHCTRKESVFVGMKDYVLRGFSVSLANTERFLKL